MHAKSTKDCPQNGAETQAERRAVAGAFYQNAFVPSAGL